MTVKKIIVNYQLSTKEINKQKRADGGCLWLSEAKKDVTSCEKPGLGANNRTTPGYPNGATQYREAVLSLAIGRQTQGTETSQYLQEKKTKVIAPVVASERATAQTGFVSANPGL